MRKLSAKQRLHQIRANRKHAARAKREKRRRRVKRRPQAKHKNESSETYGRSNSGTKMYPVQNRRDPAAGRMRVRQGVNG